jgi:hypothetical protein
MEKVDKTIPFFCRDTNVLQLLNSLLKCIFRNSDARDLVVNYFVKKHQVRTVLTRRSKLL